MIEQKKELVYSELTDTVYYIDGKGQKVELPAGNFIQMILLWLNEGKLPETGKSSVRRLKVAEQVHWELSCKRIV
jgi:hypothetical protein